MKPVASGLGPCCCCGSCGKQVPLRSQCQVGRKDPIFKAMQAEVYWCAFITCICPQLSRRVDSAVKLAKLVKQTLNPKGLFEGGCLLCTQFGGASEGPYHPILPALFTINVNPGTLSLNNSGSCGFGSPTKHRTPLLKNIEIKFPLELCLKQSSNCTCWEA